MIDVGMFGRIKRKARKVGSKARSNARSSLKSSVRATRRFATTTSKAVKTQRRSAKRAVRKTSRKVRQGVLAGAKSVKRSGKGIVRGGKSSLVKAGSITKKLVKRANPLGWMSRARKMVMPLLIVALVGGGLFFIYPVLKPVLMARKGAGKISAGLSSITATRG